VPFYERPFLAMYGDSGREEMTEEIYLVIEHLIMYVGSHLKVFFKNVVPPLNTLELEE
jgi:hypothetical protein